MKPGRMYFTFFLCSDKWPETGAALNYIDRLIESFSLRGGFDVIAQVMSDSPRAKPSITGDYHVCRRDLEQRRIKSLRIASREWSSGSDAEFYLFLENERPNLGHHPAGASGGNDQAGSTQRMFTFSIRKDVWKKNEATIPQFLSMIESFFVENRCYYGNGHERDHIISGPYDLVKGTSLNQPMRVADIDYREQVPGIYEYNYLSSWLLRRLNNPERLCEIEGVSCRILDGGAETEKALAVHLDQHEPDVVAQVAGHLKPIMC